MECKRQCSVLVLALSLHTCWGKTIGSCCGSAVPFAEGRCSEWKCCLFAVGSPTANFDGQNRWSFSTRQIAQLAFNVIALLSDWLVSTSLVSDHLPILITINSELSSIDGPRRTYINFKKAEWARYFEACDKYLAEAGQPRTVEQAEKAFCKAVNRASGLFIQVGRILHFQPTVPALAKSLADEWDRKCGLNPADDTLYDLNKQIKKLVVEDMRTKWQSAVDKCDHLTGTSHLWRLAMGLIGKQPHNSPSKGVRFADNTYRDPKMIANKFVHQFTSPPIRLTGDYSKRQLTRQFY